MIYCIKSSEFMTAINNTSLYKLILESYIVLAGKDIVTRGGYDNVVNYNRVLYPSSDVSMCSTIHEMKNMYFDQLKGYKDIISNIVYSSIVENTNFIIIASDRETKYLNFIDLIFEFIVREFKYYPYTKLGIVKDDFYNTNKNLKYAVKKSKKIICTFKNLAYKNTIQCPSSDEELEEALSEIREMSKKRIRQIMKLVGEEVADNLSKKEMVEILREYATSLPFD